MQALSANSAWVAVDSAIPSRRAGGACYQRYRGLANKTTLTDWGNGGASCQKQSWWLANVNTTATMLWHSRSSEHCSSSWMMPWYRLLPINKVVSKLKLKLSCRICQCPDQRTIQVSRVNPCSQPPNKSALNCWAMTLVAEPSSASQRVKFAFAGSTSNHHPHQHSGMAICPGHWPTKPMAARGVRRFFIAVV